MLAAGFVNPGLLAGLALAAVPVVIHLLSRRRFRRLPWGATRFLLEAMAENRRRIRFEQWLLLALRCLAMALLALLVARPFVQPGLVAELLGRRGHVQRIVVLDDSASLAYRVGAAPEFDRLRTAATRLVQWLAQEAGGEPLTFYLTSQPEAPLTEDTPLSGATVDELLQQVARLEPVAVSARPARVLARVAERLRAEGESAPADVYVLSDFQRTDWLAVTAETRPDEQVIETPAPADSAASGSPFEALTAIARERTADGAGLRVILVASGVPGRANTAIDALVLERPQIVAGVPCVVIARVANHTGQTLEATSLHGEVDGAALPPVPVPAIVANDRRDVVLETIFAEPGYRALTVQLNRSDSFSADDVRRLAVEVKETLAVLLVNGQPNSSPHRDEVYLLRNALSPPGPFASGVRVEVCEADEIVGLNIAQYDCIMLCNVPPPGEEALEALEAYARGGGGIVITLGSEVGSPDEYNRGLYRDGTGLLPLALTQPTSSTERPEGVGLLRTIEHPITAMFPAGEAGLSEYVHFRGYYRCDEPAPGAGAPGEVSQPANAPARPALVLACYADDAQSPALIERSFGRGRVMLFTSTVDLDWNDWPRAVDGSYVVTMLELVQYIARRGTHPAELLAGEPLTLPISPERFELSAVFKTPSYPEEPPVVGSADPAGVALGELALLRGPRTRELGTFTVELTGRTGPSETRPLCVNLAPRESDLAVARARELDAALVGVPHEIIAAGEGFLGGGERSRREVWPALVVFVVVVLMAEQILAWWFGRASVERGLSWSSRSA